MRTPKSLIVLAALSLAIPGGAASAAPSGTRKAAAIVRIAVDSDIIRLDDEAVSWLLGYSGILGRAARDALGIEAAENPGAWIKVQPLLQPAGQAGGPGTQPSSTRQAPESGSDAEMMRQLEQVYGSAYMTQMGLATRKPSEKQQGVEIERGAEQAVTCVLSVQLPDDVTPAAEEFLKATVEHLRQTLAQTCATHKEQVHRQLKAVESWRQEAEDEYLTATGARSPAQQRVQEQLDTIVDLSGLSRPVALSQAVDELRRSVEPPVQIVVLWRDLQENAGLPPTVSVSTGPLANVKLGTALDVVLKAVSGGGRTQLSYRITDSVITVATAETLAGYATPTTGWTTETDVGALDVERRALSRQIRSLELDLAGLMARQKAIGERIAVLGNQARERLAKDTVTQELQKLVQVSIANLNQMEKLQASGRANELETAKLREALARANIDLARREEELSQSAGGGQIEQLSQELSRIEIDMAEKQGQFDVLREQLEEIQREISAATSFDPRTARLRIARQTLDAAGQRLAELKRRLLSLQEPTVTIISAN